MVKFAISMILLMTIVTLNEVISPWVAIIFGIIAFSLVFCKNITCFLRKRAR